LNQDKQGALDFLIGVGISSVTIDSFSSRGKNMKNQNLLGFTPSFGVIIELGNT